MDISEAIRAELLKRRVDREIERRLEIIETYGDDREDGAVIKFEKRMPVGRQTWLAGQVVNAADFNRAFEQARQNADTDGMRTYTYAGVRVGGKWYLTGATEVENARTWDDLVMWMAGYCDPVLEIIDMYPAQPVAANPQRVDLAGSLGESFYRQELDRQAKGERPNLPDDIG